MPDQLKFDSEFFQSQGPPGSDAEVVTTAGVSAALGKLQLDARRKTGNIRIVIGPRGVGKSTCLEFLSKKMEETTGKGGSVLFDAGIHIPDLLGRPASDAVSLFFQELAKAISEGKKDNVKDVLGAMKKAARTFFVFVDNLDRLHRDKNDLDFVRFLFQTGDPTFKALAKHFVITFAAAPEWAPVVSHSDLGYLNFANRVELKPVSSDELAELLRARLIARGHELHQVFAEDFVKALHVASQGNPRSAFQLLERLNERDDLGAFPLASEVFQRIIPEDLFKGAVAKLRELANGSPEVSWGVNQLSRYFDAVERSGTELGKAITTAMTAFNKGVVDDADIPNRTAFRCIAHKRENGGGWELNAPVRRVISDWGKIGLARDILLTALAQNPFTTTITDAQGLAEEFERALAFDALALDAFDRGLRIYYELQLKPYAQWRSRAELLRACWETNETLMLSIEAIAHGTRNQELARELKRPEGFSVAALTLVEETTKLFQAIGRQNPYRADLVALRELVNDITERPSVLPHLEDYQIENTQQNAVKAYEGILRNLNPRRLRRLREKDADVIARYIGAGESSHLEFKSSLRWDFHQSKIYDEIAKAATRTLCAFLNSDGGTLLLGIDPSGRPIGLKHDYATLKDRNRDGFERYVYQLLGQYMGKATAQYVEVDFLVTSGLDICEVKVSPSDDPTYFADGDGRLFYIRTGNSTEQLSTEDALKYIKRHFG